MSAWTDQLPRATIWGQSSSGGGGGNLLPPTDARRGPTRLDRYSLSDDGGKYLSYGTSGFWFPWGYKFDRDRTAENIRWQVERGALFFRALGSTGPGHWEDRTIDPTWPDYRDVLSGTTDLAHSLGARLEWTIFGSTVLTPTRQSRAKQVDDWMAAHESRREKVEFVEICNEPYSVWTGELDEIYDLAEVLRNHGWPVVGLGSDPEFHNAALDPATVWIEHYDRSSGGEGGLWRYVRQPWESKPPAINNEGKGIDSSIEADDDPVRQVMFGCVTWLCNGPAHVVHHGAGIRGGGEADLARGRKANAWEQPTLDAILTGLAKMRAVLPADLPSWPTRCHTNPKFQGTFPFDTGPLDGAYQSGAFMRMYAAIADPHFVVLPLNLTQPVRMEAYRRMTFKTYHPVSGALLSDTTLDPRQAMMLGPDPGGVVMVGHYL